MRPRLVLHLVLLLALTGCGSLGGMSEALPTVVLQGGNASTLAPVGSGGARVTASGVVLPARQATLAFTLGGSVRSVQAEVGDPVRAGQVLAELENTVLAAQAETARRALREQTSPAAVAAAEQALATAQDALKDSEYRRTVQQEGYRASPETVRAAEAKLLLADEEVDRNKARYDQASGDADKAQALVNLTAAQQRRDAALRELNWFRGKPSEVDQALLNAEVAIAQAALQEAEWYLAAVQGQAVPADASGVQLTRLQNARDQLAAAEAALAGSRLTAPFDGTLAALEIDLGDYVQPGVPAAIVADLSRLRVETTDLSELDVTKVPVGAVCTVSIEALGDQADGHVIRLALLPTALGGDVVYAATLELDSIPERLRAGMSAEVSCEAP
jgi:multidrug resistance efflux pump